MKIGRFISIGLLAGFVLFGGLTRSALAAHHKSGSNQHYRLNRNILGKHHAPKKLRNSKTKFRSPYSGGILYGKPVKQK